ncbi:MAG TPA: NfeD family protein [Candidatus Ornithomonoglobus merdipullorum]|uniref:NfeD family protein n=1 Tax=Candidatus Ornithomonoglobus merdipullorum TaxID=2840895 RepID=A0A9D1MBK5_9FIRM|nr:NfeD family protein [Candidatus Ornithomonoglobus merdipullorum]
MLGMEILWLAGIVAFIILEAVTYQLISIWFVIGAIGGLIAAMCGVDFYVQMAVFLAISILLLILLRPVSMKLIKKQDFKSNADSLIGKSILVTQEVNNIKGTGQGKVNGMVWTVRSETDETIAAGELAEIKRIEGVKLIVKKQ